MAAKKYENMISEGKGIMSKLKTEKEMISPHEELLRSTKELNEAIRDILENGTLEQKVELLVSDYKKRIANDEFQKRQELQKSLLSERLNIKVSAIPNINKGGIFKGCIFPFIE